MPPTRTLLRGLAVLETLAESADGASLTEIAIAIDLDRATVTRLLQTLSHAGYVRNDPQTRRYRLSGKIMRLAGGAGSQLDLRVTAKPYLVALRDTANETVHLGILDEVTVTYIDKIESGRSIGLISSVGQSHPLHYTALGKALLSALPDHELRPRLARLSEQGLARKTSRTITTIAELTQALGQARERGFAIDDRESEDNVTCVAAPIIGGDNGATLAAVSISGPTFRMAGQMDELGRAVRRTADEVSLELGGRLTVER